MAIVGSSRATDYGMEMAKSLARGLAASGVTVASGLSDGIPVAALAGALEVDGETITVLPGGLDVACPVQTALAVSTRERRPAAAWRRCRAGAGRAAGRRPPASGSSQDWPQLTVVVEAQEGSRELAGARNCAGAGTNGRAPSPGA